MEPEKENSIQKAGYRILSKTLQQLLSVPNTVISGNIRQKLNAAYGGWEKGIERVKPDIIKREESR
jgi:hypothetical protein